MRGWTLIVGLLMAILLGGGLGMTLGALAGWPLLGGGLGAVLCGAVACFLASRRSPTRRAGAAYEATGDGGGDIAWLTLPFASTPSDDCGDTSSDGGSCDGGGDGGGGGGGD